MGIYEEKKVYFWRINLGITKDRFNNKAYLSGYALEKKYFTSNRKFVIKDIVLYEYLNEGKSICVRCTRIILKTGEIEYLFMNLTEEEISYDELKELYNLRWKIETNYGYLKNNVQIESITSGKKILIEQDIYSRIYVANILQLFINDAEIE